MAQLTLDQAFQIALAHHQGGRLEAAEALYRQIIAHQPEHVDALHLLGVIAAQSGGNDVAVDFLRRAISLRPNFAEANFNLGNVLKRKGELDDAIAAYRRAVALRHNYPKAHYNLGVSLHDKGEIGEAIIAYREALSLDPRDAEACKNLALALKEKGRLSEAIAAYRQAIELRPNFPEAYFNLSNVLKANGQIDESIAAARQAIALKPDYVEAINNLGVSLRGIGQIDQSITAFNRVIELRPDLAEAHCNLGNALKDKRDHSGAIVAYEQAVALNPASAEARNNLGVALRDVGKLDEAIAAIRQAIALNANNAEAHCNLGNLLKDQGQLDEAIAAFRRAVALDPSSTQPHCNLVYTSCFHAGYDAQMIAAEQRAWNEQHAEPLRKFIGPHSNDRDPNRRLRVGYVSPNFCNHCQSHFMVPLLSSHDHQEMEVFCYADVMRPDEFTERLQGYADHWRNIVGQSDEQVAGKIREDQIDILVDLNMHMAGNRLRLFARKPAPVQVCWLAYPGSTGLSAIDYRLSDPYLDPPGMDESIYSEKTIRLPDSFWCYDPLEGRDLSVNSLPVLKAGVITFGCLNNFCKLNEGILTLWARVMPQVKNSRLLLLAGQGSHRTRTIQFMAEQGIEAGRVEFLDYRPRRQYMELYRRIDLGLDSFPYNGHTTSLDSFWMGVPVVTLVGKTTVARAGLCQLSNLGLGELAAGTAEDFVRIAVELANDLPRLGKLRSTLRKSMEQSALMDGPRFARNVEVAYRRMWVERAVPGPGERTENK